MKGEPSTDRIEGVLQPEWLSIFLKLEGLGLATIVERMATQIPPNEQVFALLPKGADFVRYIQGAVGTPSAVTPPNTSTWCSHWNHSLAAQAFQLLCTGLQPVALVA